MVVRAVSDDLLSLGDVWRAAQAEERQKWESWRDHWVAYLLYRATQVGCPDGRVEKELRTVARRMGHAPEP